MFHQVAYHFKVMFGCSGHLRDKCLKLGPLVRNLLAIHQPLRIWGSLTCRIKIQHKSHPTDPPRAPQLAAFSSLCHICLQSEPWMVSRSGCSYDCQESPSPRAPQGFEGLLLVQASTHFPRFSWPFLSPSGMNLCHSQLESEEEQQGSIYFLELLSDSLKVLLPARTASEFNNKRFWVSWIFFPPFLKIFACTSGQSPKDKSQQPSSLGNHMAVGRHTSVLDQVGVTV